MVTIHYHKTDNIIINAKIILCESTRDTPIIRAIDFMLCEGRYFDYSLSEIARHSRVGWSTLHRFWPKLVESGIVIKTRQIGRATPYKLNEKNPITQELIRLDN